MTKLFLDVTTLVTLISDVTFFAKELATRFGDLEEWAKISDEVYRQLKDEAKDPIYPKLMSHLQDHEWCTIEPVISKTRQLIEDYGTPTELARMEELLTKLQIVPVEMSEESWELQGKQWDQHENLNRKVIGTCHEEGYTLVTANLKAVSSAVNSNLEIEFDYLVHRARCFLGTKYQPEMVEKRADGSYQLHWREDYAQRLLKKIDSLEDQEEAQKIAQNYLNCQSKSDRHTFLQQLHTLVGKEELIKKLEASS